MSVSIRIEKLHPITKYTGLATIAVEWLALLLFFLIEPAYFGGKYPISFFATLPNTRVIFNVCYTLAAIFFAIFFSTRLAVHSRRAVQAMNISMVIFSALALYPYSASNALSYFIHHSLALLAGLFFCLGIVFMANSTKDIVVAYVTKMILILSVILLILFAIALPNAHPSVFVLEAGSWLLWQIWVLWITHRTWVRSSNRH